MNDSPEPEGPAVFQGEVMTCCVCGAQEQFDAGAASQWRAIELGQGDTRKIFYGCPKEFPGLEASAGAFDLAYQRVLKIAIEKFKPAGQEAGAPGAKRRCRVCGCTELAPCVVNGTPCHWVGEDLCSACAGEPGGEPPRPFKLNDRDLRHLAKVDFGVRIDGVRALQLLSVLQLACRHPQFQGPTRAAAEKFARLMQQQISVTKNLTAIAEAGWRPEFDEPVHGLPSIAPGAKEGE